MNQIYEHARNAVHMWPGLTPMKQYLIGAEYGQPHPAGAPRRRLILAWERALHATPRAHNRVHHLGRSMALLREGDEEAASMWRGFGFLVSLSLLLLLLMVWGQPIQNPGFLTVWFGIPYVFSLVAAVGGYRGYRRCIRNLNELSITFHGYDYA